MAFWASAVSADIDGRYHGADGLGDADERLRVSHEKVAAARQMAQQALDDGGAKRRGEVDQDVATEDGVVLAEGIAVLHEIEAAETKDAPHLIAGLHRSAARARAAQHVAAQVGLGNARG